MGPKIKNFRNPTDCISLNAEFYADHYLQKEYTLKINCSKDRIRWSCDRFFSSLYVLLPLLGPTLKIL